MRRPKLFWLSAMLWCGTALLLAGMTALSAQAQAPVALDMPAPELVGGPWLNTPKNQPIKLASRRGKVTIVEFWTFG